MNIINFLFIPNKKHPRKKTMYKKVLDYLNFNN